MRNRFSSSLVTLLGLFLAGLPLAVSTHHARAQAPQRNVLLLISDDQGLDAGCYGNAAIKTPNLDRLAATGTLFTHAYAGVSSCSPSRSVILSGLYNHTNGMYGLAHGIHAQKSHPWVRGLPRLLRDGGWRTGIIGKYHVAPDDAYRFETHITRGLMGNRHVSLMAERAQEFFTADERPFFLTIGYSDPHRARKGFANDRDYPGVEEVVYDPKDVVVPYHLPDTPEVRADLADYYQSVSRMDQGVGMVMKALEETGHTDDTLVIFISDNGIPFPGAKSTLYDAGIRLPMIVRSPKQVLKGLRNDAMVSFMDIAPTVLHWTGAPGPEYELPGRSLLPIIDQEGGEGWNRIFASHTMHEITMPYPMRAIRTRKHKLIWNLDYGATYQNAADLYNSPTWQGILSRNLKRMGKRTVKQYLHRPEYELYDLEQDPNELRNLATDPKHALTFGVLRKQLEQMMRDTKDPWAIRLRDRHRDE